jgi:hypothetical protein
MKSEVRKRLMPNAKRLLMPHILSKQVNQRLIKLWQKTYAEITKNKSPRLSTSISGLKELKDVLAAAQIKETGLHQILIDIEEIARVNQWTSKKKSTTKSEITKLYNTQKTGITSHYIKEIERAVKEDPDLKKWIADWSA